MSLINEALKKARAEAEERAAEERASGGPASDYRPPRAHLPERDRWGAGIVVGLALGVLLAAGGAVAFWLGRDAPPVTSSAAPVVPSVVAEPAPIATSVAPEPVDPVTAPEAAEPSPEPTSSAETAREPAPTPDPEPEAEAETEPEIVPEPTPSEPASPEPVAPEPAPPEPAPEPEARDEDRPTLIRPPERTGQVDENVYVLVADLGDVVLELDFIVWGRAPFAQVNGRQVEVDQAVDGGFLVDSIERDRVVLRHADGRTVILRVR